MTMTLTEKAAEKAKAILQEKGIENGYLRVFVVGGGCSGYQYGMALTKEVDAEDFVIEQHGVKIVVDPDSALLLDGAEVDWQDDLMRSGFSIFNPNATKSCACGSSFDTKDGGGKPKPCGR